MECDRHDFLSFWAILCSFTPVLKITWWYKARNTEIFLSFWAIFCSLTFLPSLKIKILKKWKKDLDMSSFYTYASWDMECDGHNFLSFWAMLCSFNPVLKIIWWYKTRRTEFFFAILGNFLTFLTSPKIKILKKWRYYFTHVYHKLRSYDVWFLRYEKKHLELSPF